MRRSSRLRWPAATIPSMASPITRRAMLWAGIAAPVAGPARTTAAARNLISGNAYVGIQVVGPGASNDTIQGNSIGTVADVAAAAR